MYTNIPVADTIEITKQLLLESKMDKKNVSEIVNLLKAITRQNYFTFKNEFYNQEEGLPMGSPLSGTLANIYLNHIENKYIINNRNKLNKNIIYWYRYVDNILLLFDGTQRQLSSLQKYINNIHRNIKFTLEIENSKAINFLDLTIKNKESKHVFKIFRKDTQTDHTIHKTSNHPIQYRMATYNHLIHRLNAIPMMNEDYTEELNIIKHTAVKNGYNALMIDQMNKKYQHRNNVKNLTTLNNIEDVTHKYIKVDFNTTTSKIIQRILPKYGYTAAFSTRNKLERKLTSTYKPIEDTGVYKISCGECQAYYVGQTGRSFETRFKEHTKEINKPIRKSNFAEHISITNHTYKNYEENLQILYKCRKGPMMNRIEEYEIYKHKDDMNLLNDKVNTRNNQIYDLIIKNSTRKRDEDKNTSIVNEWKNQSNTFIT